VSCGVVLLIVTRVWHKLAEVPTPGSGDGARWRESALPAACLPPPDCWCGTLFKVWTLSSLGPGYQDFLPLHERWRGRGINQSPPSMLGKLPTCGWQLVTIRRYAGI